MTGVTPAQLFVFYQGGGDNSGQLWYVTFNGTDWGAPVQVIPSGYSASSSIMSESPSAMVYSYDMETWVLEGTEQVEEEITAYNLIIFYQGTGNDGTLWEAGPGAYNSIDGFYCSQILPVSVTIMSTTGAVNSTSASTIMSQSPAPSWYNGWQYAFYEGLQNNGQLWFYDMESEGQSELTQVTSYSPNTSPSTVVYNNDLYVFSRPEELQPPMPAPCPMSLPPRQLKPLATR